MKLGAAMTGKSTSIGRLMAMIALVAANLALLRFVELTILGAYGFVLGVLNFLVLWKGILGRPLRVFHYTLLIVSVIASVVLAVQVAMGRLQLLGPVVRWYQQMKGDLTGSAAWFDFLHIGEFWAAGLLGFLIALAAGLLASWLEKAKGWDVAAFLRGALAGFGVATLTFVLVEAMGPTKLGNSGVVARYICLAIFVITGGLLGLA